MVEITRRTTGSYSSSAQPSVSIVRSAGAVDNSSPLSALLERAIRQPDATAFISEDDNWSCARLASRSAKLAVAFEHHGVRSGDRIALHMHNRAEAVVVYLACWYLGATAVPLNTRFKAPEVAEIIARVQPRLYLSEADLCELSHQVPADILTPNCRFAIGLEAPTGSVLPWFELEASFDDEAVKQAPTPTDHSFPAVLLGTSGTTGPSKLVVWTHRNLNAFADSAAGRGIAGDDLLPICSPLVHASGVRTLSACLLVGAVPILLKRFEPNEVLEAISKYRCTTFVGLPFMCAELARQQRTKPRNVASLRCCFSTGDVCPAEIEEAFAAELGRPLLSFWASTEDAGASIPASRPGALTKFLPSSQIRLIDQTGHSADFGELIIRSQSTSPGYWLGPDQLDHLPNGWFHSGDLMRREPDGQFRYVGRVKDLIVRGGSNISPVEVEVLLRRQIGIADAAVAGVPDSELGQRVGAVVV
jgi:long-chain acyl-CoA synthetase